MEDVKRGMSCHIKSVILLVYSALKALLSLGTL